MKVPARFEKLLSLLNALSSNAAQEDREQYDCLCNSIEAELDRLDDEYRRFENRRPAADPIAEAMVMPLNNNHTED